MMPVLTTRSSSGNRIFPLLATPRGLPVHPLKPFGTQPRVIVMQMIFAQAENRLGEVNGRKAAQKRICTLYAHGKISWCV